MKTKRIIVIMEGEPGNYSAYSNNMPRLSNVTGVGNTIEECKQSAYNCVNILIEIGNLPPAQYELIFEYDKDIILELVLSNV